MSQVTTQPSGGLFICLPIQICTSYTSTRLFCAAGHVDSERIVAGISTAISKRSRFPYQFSHRFDLQQLTSHRHTMDDHQMHTSMLLSDCDWFNHHQNMCRNLYSIANSSTGTLSTQTDSNHVHGFKPKLKRRCLCEDHSIRHRGQHGATQNIDDHAWLR